MNFDSLKPALTPPRLLSPVSAWQEHIPFAMALVDLLRPSCIVELGTHMGDSYCAFCQAVAALELPANCTAVDTWEGDAHAGRYGPEILAGLKAHHDPLYGRFSRLLQRRFDEAAATVPDGSIDLLHIDGLHTYEAVAHDFDTWLPKLSPRGVVIMHDTQVRRNDFAVWQFWDRIAGRYPAFEFTHGHGLGILAVGPEVPPAFAAFLRWAQGAPDQARAVFAQLGQLLPVARDGAALWRRRSSPLADAAAKIAAWRPRARAALAASGEAVCALPGDTPASHRHAHLESILDFHAPFWRSVSVVIPTRDGGPRFGQLLQALARQSFAGTIETLVIDSGSADGTPALARQAGAQVLEIPPVPPADFNHGATRNRAISQCTGDIIVLLSQDAVPADEQLIARLVAPFADPDIAGVYARQRPRPDHGTLTAWRVEHSFAGGATPRTQRPLVASAFAALTPRERMERCVFDNVCSAVRACAWREFPFPPRHFAEDMAWAQCVIQSGWSIVYEPTALVVHSHERGLKHDYRRHAAHAAAMRDLFAFQDIVRWTQLPGKLWNGMRQDAAIVLPHVRGFRQKCAARARIPLAVTARVMGTYMGGRTTRRS